MLLANPQLISFINYQISFEGHVQRHYKSEISQKSNVSKLKSSDPFQNSSVFVDDFSLLEVKGLARVLTGHLHKRLVTEGRVIDIFLKFQQSIHGSSKEFRMSQSI